MLRDCEAIIDLNLNPTTWNNSQLKVVINPLKIKEDTALTARKAELYTRYLEWSSSPTNQ